MRLRQKVQWEQSAPGRGVESKRITRTGTIIDIGQGYWKGVVTVRPDDEPGTIVTMGTKAIQPLSPAAPRRSKDLEREKAKYRRNM